MAGGNQACNAKLRGDILSFPVKIATAIYSGSNVALDATGYLVPAADSAGMLYVGVAENSCTAADAVASGTVSIPVRRHGIVRMTKNTTTAVTDLGQLVCIHTAHSSSVNGLVGLSTLADGCLYGVVVGRVVRREPNTLGGATYTNNYLMVDISDRDVVPARSPLIAITATAALTAAQVAVNPLVTGTHGSSAIEVTLPAAAAANAGKIVKVAQGGAAAVTVKVAAGFGGGSTGTDIFTLAQGVMAICESDGTNWYCCSVAPGG